MGKEILKWLAALGTGAAAAALAWISGNAAAPAGIDPLVAGIVVAILKRIVDFLVSKIPAGTNA